MNNFNMDEFFKPDDNNDETRETNKPCPRKTGKAYRRLMARRKKKKRMEIISCGTGYNPTVGTIVEKTAKRKPVSYIQYPKNSNCQRFWKHYTNKVARKRELPVKGNGHRRCVDYLNELY